MFIGKVISSIVSTVKHPSYSGKKLFAVRPIHPVTRNEYGQTFVAIDLVDAGIGDIVLVSQEGGAVRSILKDKTAPIRSFILAIVEDWQIEE